MIGSQNLKTLVCAFLVVLASVSNTSAADRHRIVILSEGGSQSRVRLFNVESEKLLGELTVAMKPDLAISPDGKQLAILSNPPIAGLPTGLCQLDVYTCENLAKLGTGRSPVEERTHYIVPMRPYVAFGKSSDDLLVQHMSSFLSHERGPDKRFLTYDQTSLAVVRVGAGTDPGGAYSLAYAPTVIPRATAVVYLRTLEWPIICVWNPLLHAIETVDLREQRILHRLRLADEATLQAGTPQDDARFDLKFAGFIKLMKSSGEVVSGGDGKYAYYIPKNGYPCRISLVDSLPKVVVRSESKQDSLIPRTSAVSEVAGKVFALVGKLNPTRTTYVGSNVIRAFKCDTLVVGSDLTLGVTNCSYIEASRDGALIYALDREGKLSVVDASTEKQIRVMDVGERPMMVFAVD